MPFGMRFSREKVLLGGKYLTHALLLNEVTNQLLLYSQGSTEKPGGNIGHPPGTILTKQSYLQELVIPGSCLCRQMQFPSISV